MKKQNLKNLSLNKKSVSNLTVRIIKGGDDTVAPLRCTIYYTDIECTFQCGTLLGCGTTGPAPTDDNASACKCL